MPAFWIRYRPLLKMQHQLGTDHIQKLSESLTRMSAPLPETPTLTMPDNEAIHEKYHIPMTADRSVTTHLILIEPEIIFPMQIELVYCHTRNLPADGRTGCHASADRPPTPIPTAVQT
jgi:hypothetical protein